MAPGGPCHDPSRRDRQQLGTTGVVGTVTNQPGESDTATTGDTGVASVSAGQPGEGERGVTAAKSRRCNGHVEKEGAGERGPTEPSPID